MKAAADILMDLVSIPSVSNVSNRPVIEYAGQYLDSAKWHFQTYCYRDPAGAEKVNLIAVTIPNAAENVALALVCHTDTVPFDPNWKEAVNPALRDGKVYGRGSCDVKGFLACLLEAVNTIDLQQLQRPLAVVLTADEEIGCVGAKHLARENALRSRYIVIGEPTQLAPVKAGKGYGAGVIVVHGKEAHSALPAHGRSAIRDAARVLERLDNVAAHLASRVDSDFDPPFTTLNAGMIQGGTARNIVAGECRITLDWRPIPAQDPTWAAALIEQELAHLRHEFPGLEAELIVTRRDAPFAASPTTGLASLFASLTNRPATTVAFGTEAAHLAPLASETIVFGPGDMTTAHRTGECIDVNELNQCVDYLRHAILHLCRDRAA